MSERVLSGAEWCVYNDLFWLQKHGVVPGYPWDIMRVGEEKLRGHDQGFGGSWQIMEREFVFLWDSIPNELASSAVKQPTTLTLLMRGEIPEEGDGKQQQGKEAQRNWFVDKLKIESPTGRKIGAVDEVIVLEAESRDDVMNLLKPPPEKQ